MLEKCNLPRVDFALEIDLYQKIKRPSSHEFNICLKKKINDRSSSM